MREVCRRAVDQGITGVAFGDLFLRDIRTYREAQLKHTGLEPFFWEQPTAVLACEMIAAGLRAKLTCVDTKQTWIPGFGKSFECFRTGGWNSSRRISPVGGLHAPLRIYLPQLQEGLLKDPIAR